MFIILIEVTLWHSKKLSKRNAQDSADDILPLAFLAIAFCSDHYFCHHSGLVFKSSDLHVKRFVGVCLIEPVFVFLT